LKMGWGGLDGWGVDLGVETDSCYLAGYVQALSRPKTHHRGRLSIRKRLEIEPATGVLGLPLIEVHMKNDQPSMRVPKSALSKVT